MTDQLQPTDTPEPPTRRLPRGPWRILIVATASIAVLLLGAVAVVALTMTGPTEESELVTEERKITVLELRAGSCFQKPTAPTILDVKPVPCTEPHEAEVLFPVQFPGPEFPGDDAAFDTVLKKCWEHVMGRTFDPSIADKLETYLFSPTAATWETGRRNGICAVYRGDGQPLTAPVGATK